jgi:hypothetical protein
MPPLARLSDTVAQGVGLSGIAAAVHPLQGGAAHLGFRQQAVPLPPIADIPGDFDVASDRPNSPPAARPVSSSTISMKPWRQRGAERRRSRWLARSPLPWLVIACDAIAAGRPALKLAAYGPRTGDPIAVEQDSWPRFGDAVH